MNLTWGLFIFSLVSGFGFDSSHSITSLNESFFTLEKCLDKANKLNNLSLNEKQVGLESNIFLRYVCIAKIGDGKAI